MHYYKLYSRISYPDRWFVGDINVDDNWAFTNGVELDIQNYNDLRVEIDQDGVELDFTETDAYAVPIVSESFAECIYEYINEIQLIPISIPNTVRNYFVLVVKNKLECVDEKRSDFLIYEEGNEIRPDKVGDYEAINVLRIDTDKANKSIFRISRYEVLLIINEDIKKKLERAGLIGLKFELVT